MDDSLKNREVIDAEFTVIEDHQPWRLQWRWSYLYYAAYFIGAAFWYFSREG